MFNRVCIAGVSGLLGQACLRYFSQIPSCRILGLSTSPFELSGIAYSHLPVTLPNESETLNAQLRKIQPDLIINCIALADLGQCEKNPALADALNAQVPILLAKEASKYGAQFIHISTDQVFDGTASEPYKEDAKPNPLHVYGKTKLKGDESVLEFLPQALVARTNIVGLRGRKNQPTFVEWLYGALQSKEPITLFTDYMTSSLPVDYLVPLLVEVVEKKGKGILNLAASDFASKYEFGQMLTEMLDIDFSCVKKGRLKESNMHPPRPPFLPLNVKRAESLLNRPLPSVRDTIQKLSEELQTRERVAHP